MNLIRGIFYKEDGAAEGTPSGDIQRGGTQNVSSFLKDAPIMNKAQTGDLPGTEGGAPAPNVPQPNTGEGKNEPVIKGPGSNVQQPDPNQSQGTAASGEEPKGEPTGVTTKPGDKVKIGDLELTTEEWERVGRDYSNDTTWRSNNTKKSQIINKFTDEMLNDVAPYALSQRKLPDNFKDSLGKLENMPTEITVKDDEGFDIKIKTSDIPDEYLEAVKAHVLSTAFPEYMQTKGDYDQLKVETENATKRIEKQDMDSGMQQAVQFMQTYPDFAVTLFQDDRLDKVLADIFNSGEQHPEFANAKRLASILTSISTGVFRNFEEAANGLFGNSLKKAETNSQIEQNQSAGKPEEPGGRSANQPTDIVDRMATRGKGASYAKLNRS